MPRVGLPLLTAWGVSADADLVLRTLIEHGPQAVVDGLRVSQRAEPVFSAAAVRAAAPLDRALFARRVSVLTLGVPPGPGDAAAGHGARRGGRRRPGPDHPPHRSGGLMSERIINSAPGDRMNRLLVLVAAAILGAASIAGAVVVDAAGGPVPVLDRVLADPPPDSHTPAEPGGGVNTVPCPNCWT
jgi:hypothetical protein